ncbi:tetratricopeptide repeat protein [Myxococcus stipitatus]|uniref:energy transducer TonB n=1 Tax=Myxococcus stipitatus TaxID=83455 RepID=UPI00314501AF
MPEFPEEVHREGTVVMVVLECTLGTDGRPRNIQVVEASTQELTGIVVRSLAGFRFFPATFAGHPIEIRYGMSASAYPQAMKLTPEQELAWGQVRVKTFPKSLQAWLHLSRVLARDNAQAPGYEQALRELNFLSPSYWWSATELAWLYAEAGRYEEAAPLALTGRRHAPENAYALETSARVAFHQNRCPEAVEEQRLALSKLPEEWPREERERFERTLADYQRQCAAPPSVPVAPST